MQHYFTISSTEDYTEEYNIFSNKLKQTLPYILEQGVIDILDLYIQEIKENIYLEEGTEEYTTDEDTDIQSMPNVLEHFPDYLTFLVSIPITPYNNLDLYRFYTQ